MSVTSGSNKWASRAIVVLQFAAWSAVGIVLLQKGVVSLQKGSNSLPANDVGDNNNNNEASQHKLHEEEKLEAIATTSSTGDDDVFSVIPFDGQMMVDDNKKSDTTRAIVSGNNRSIKETNEKDGESTTRVSIDSLDHQPSVAAINNTVKQLDESKFNNDEKIIPAIVNKMEKSSSRSNKFTWQEQSDAGNKVAFDGKNGVEATERNKQVMKKEKIGQVDDSGVINYRAIAAAAAKRQRHGESTWSPITTRKQLRIGQVSVNGRGDGGASAAIAMVTVGAIMLVLGPAVIILRTFDEKRQERRFLKLSRDEDDLPPTYEQATNSAGAASEPAPPYSSLNLNSISSPA